MGAAGMKWFESKKKEVRKYEVDGRFGRCFVVIDL